MTHNRGVLINQQARGNFYFSRTLSKLKILTKAQMSQALLAQLSLDVVVWPFLKMRIV